MGVKLDRIRRAAEIADKALAKVLHLLRPGLSEAEIARCLLLKIRLYGGDGFSFRPIVASGARSALPHGRASARKLRRGDTVVIDFGVKYKGFCSDMTRSFVIGEPNAKQKKIYKVLIESQKKAIRRVAEGVRAFEVDKAARDHIKKNKFGHCFIHSTGHGIGKKVHEAPKISLNDRSTLKSGMILTVEPGIYFKGWGGMRIEDMVLVTKRGCEVLTRFPKGRLSA